MLMKKPIGTSSLVRIRQFWGNALKEPFSIGAVAPSSVFLARKITKGIDQDSFVIELGAGTGVVTKAILHAGVAPKNLILLEQNPDFAKLLKERFSDVTVLRSNALDLEKEASHVFGSVDFIVSGLPLMLFNADQKESLLSQAFKMLKPSGCFHQFTYGGKCPVEQSILHSLNLKATFLNFTLFNLPPAFVYRLERC
ncbi:MAG: SAM-dependent methyltransferase [Rhodospirillaceae bacterium]|nr:SAM-dependent methyltransferase [Rhodospirillaceae bacterium]|tara:strand:+ start:1765 stop:2355 length:591 start_codon:yes stop_codon:yes gene_type:complete